MVPPGIGKVNSISSEEALKQPFISCILFVQGQLRLQGDNGTKTQTETREEKICSITFTSKIKSRDNLGTCLEQKCSGTGYSDVLPQDTWEGCSESPPV